MPDRLASLAPKSIRDPWAARLFGAASILLALGSSGIVGALVSDRMGDSGLQRAQIKAIARDAKAARNGVDRINNTLQEAYERDTARWQLTEQAICKLNGAPMFRGMNCYGSSWWQPQPNDFQWAGPKYFANHEWGYIQRPQP